MCVCTTIISLRNAPTLFIKWTEVFVERLQDSLPLLIPIIDLDLLVIVCNQLLHIDSSGFCNSKHDFALSLDCLVGKLSRFKLQSCALLSLFGTHLVFLLACTLEGFEISIRWLFVLHNVPPEVCLCLRL